MKNFKDFWKERDLEKGEKLEMMDGVKDIVEAMDMGMLEEPEFTVKTSEISKPGNSIHSEKWDACVREVKTQRADVDAYAVCTSQLGESSFKAIDTMTKSELRQAMSELRKAMDIEDAGPTPFSLLARQDLESKTTRKSDDEKFFSDARNNSEDNSRLNEEKKVFTNPEDEVPVIVPRNEKLDIVTNEVVPLTDEEAQALANQRVVEFCDFVSIVKELVELHGFEEHKANAIVRIAVTEDDSKKSIFQPRKKSIHEQSQALKKDALTAASNKLKEFKQEAEEASDEEEKSQIVSNIKSTQIKRQKAEINARKNEGGFSKGWKKSFYGQ